METALGISAIIISLIALVSSLYTAWLTRTSTRPLLVIDSSLVVDTPGNIPDLKLMKMAFKNVGVNPAEGVVIKIELLLPNHDKLSEKISSVGNPIPENGGFTSNYPFAYPQSDLGKSALFICRLHYTDSFFPKKWAFRKNIYYQTLYLKYPVGAKEGIHATLEDIHEIASSPADSN